MQRHDSVLEAMRALARATLTVSAVVLGIMIISLGNFVVLIHEFYPDGLALYVIVAIMAWMAAGLGGIMASIVFSVRGVSVSRVRQALSYEDLGKGDRVDHEAIKKAISHPDDETYENLVETSILALRDREEAIAQVGACTSRAQKSLLAGLLVSGIGVIIAFSALALAIL